MVKNTLLALSLFLLSTASIMMSSPPVASAANIDDMSKEEAIECLATNIYFESANESLAGKISVSMVVLNRVNDSRYPSEVCDVVYQGRYGKNERASAARKNQCQFSWACDNKSDTARNKEKLAESFQVAELVYRMYKEGFDITDGATHYHASYVNPKWAKDRGMKRVTKVDTHIFYRWDKS
jgi:spore germination cell wall hydrolase CwlJ-like protein